MAIYHMHVSSGGRADGQLAALKIAYVLREGPHGGHDDLVEWGSGHMPLWAAADPRRLFAAADAHERKNGRLYLHIWVALPNELDEIERHDLVLAIGATLTASGPRQEHGLPYVYAVHAGDPKASGEAANPHGHWVFSERINDGIARDEEQWFRRANRRNPAAGGAPKDRTLKEVTWVGDARKAIEKLINRHLELAGREERVTADSHATRIVEAEAWGDTEAAEYLRQHPPGIHLGPAAAAIERDRFRGKAGEEPELARAGEPTERGELARARMGEEERARQELARVSGQLRRAREEERRATESVAAARAVGVTDQEIVCAYEEAESVAAGSGWGAVAEAATSQAGRKEEAESAASRLGIDIAAVYRAAGGENRVGRLTEVIDIFEQARSALMTEAEIEAIREEAESLEAGAGWGTVAAEARTQSAWKERAEGAAQEAGIEDLGDVYAAARAREEHPLSALEWAIGTVWKARSALMTEAEIESVRDGSGWPALESAAARRLDRKTEAETAARGERLIDIEREYASAQERKEDPLARLVAVTGVVAGAREAFLTDEAIRAVHAAGDLRERGGGWTAVENAAEAGRTRRTRTEAVAREAGIVDIDPVYAAARSRSEDPLAALEEAIAARRRAERREAGLRELQRRPGGREMAIAHLAALVPAGQEPAEEQIDEALTAAESDAERLSRAGRIHGDQWSHLFYVAAAGALGERFSLQQVDAAMTDAEGFAERARGLSQAGRAALETAGEHPAVDELVAALERAQEAERQEEERQRRDQVARREREVRATKTGPGWLSEAQRRILQGTDRQPTLEERERIVETVRGWVRGDLDRRKQALRSTEQGAEFLDEAQRSAGAVTTLAAEEQLVEAGEKRLRQHQEAQARKRREEERRAPRRAALSPAGQELLAAWLTDLDPARSPAGGPSMTVVDQALDATESDGRLPRLEAVFTDPEQQSYYRSKRGARPPDQSTLEQIDAALEATESFVRRKQTILRYRGGNGEHPDGGALYAAARESRAPGWRPGEEIGSAVFDAVVADVESQLAERVRRAADEFEKLVPTTRPYPDARPGYRVPALANDQLDELFGADDEAFYRATVVEIGKRYQRRAGNDVAREERYDDRARSDSQQALLEDAGATERCSSARQAWSEILATVLTKYLSKLREFFQVACDRVLGGNLGERLAEHRAQVQQAADKAEAKLERRSYETGPAVPVVSDKSLEVVAGGASHPFVKEVVVEAGERYKRREVEGHYTQLERSQAERGYLHDAFEKRRRSPSSAALSRSEVEAEVFAEHRREVLEVFEVACDEVGKHQDQVQRTADTVGQMMERQHVPTLSDETLADVRAAADPFLQEVVDVVWERYDRGTPNEELNEDARREAEEKYLAPRIEQELEGQREARRASTRQAARERVIQAYRSRILRIFMAARDEVFGSGDGGGGASAGRRAAGPPFESPTPPGQERQPPGGAQAPAAAPSRTLGGSERRTTGGGRAGKGENGPSGR